MKFTLTESILLLLVTTLIPSITGFAVYLIGRFVERKAQFFVSSVSTFVFVAITLFQLAYVLSAYISPLWPIAYLICSVCGGLIHKKSVGSSPNLLQASLFMFFMGGLNYQFATWILREAIKSYHASTISVLPSWPDFVLLSFTLIAPTIAASYLLIFQNSKLRPGIDKHFDE